MSSTMDSYGEFRKIIDANFSPRIQDEMNERADLIFADLDEEIAENLIFSEDEEFSTRAPYDFEDEDFEWPDAPGWSL